MAKSTAPLGIANLKRVIAFLLITAVMLKELIANFSLTRAVSLGFHIAENQDLLKAGPLALAEFRDIDVGESQEISDFIGDEFDLENDDLEFRIEEGLDLIPEGYALIKRNLDFYQKGRTYIKTWAPADTGVFDEMQEKLAKLRA